MERNNLPNNWTFTKIENVSMNDKGSIRMGPFGSQLKKHELVDKGIKVLGIENIGKKNNEFYFGNGKYITEQKYKTLEGFTVKPYDVLITMMGTIGKSCVVPSNIGKAIISSHLLKISPNKSIIDSKFLSLIISNNKNVINQMNNHARGIVMKGLNTAIIKSLVIPVPPFNEQRRIVSKLEELFTKLDAGIEYLKKTQILLKQYRQSVLKYAFEGKLTERWRKESLQQNQVNLLLNSLENSKKIKVRRDVPEFVEIPEYHKQLSLPPTWKLISVAELLRYGILLDLKDGNHGSNHPRSDDFSTNGIPFITASQVNNYKIDYEKTAKLTGEPLKRIRVGFSYPGDVILTHKGTVGRVALCKQDCILSPQTTYYRTKKEVINPKYLMYFMSSSTFQVQLSKIKSQTTRDFVSILKQYKLFIVMCNIVEQNQIIQKIEDCFSYMDNISKNIKMNILFVIKLRQSILKYAFEGKLVHQDPNDEPAGILLERIKRDRESLVPIKKEKSKITKRKSIDNDSKQMRLM